ncbi:MAG TPA: helix-turn-helix domain-containing protein [Polyangiales bacterium]
MQLTVQDVAKLFSVPERTVYQWIDDGDIPCDAVKERYRFNQLELLEWASKKRLHVSTKFMAEQLGEGVPLPTLHEALTAGGIHFLSAGHDRQTALRAILRSASIPDPTDEAFLLQVLLARPDAGVTVNSGGVALPQVRHPILLNLPRPLVTLCLLDSPVPLGASEPTAAHAVFTLVTPTVRAHLHLLARLSGALHDPALAALVTEHAAPERLLQAVEQVEAKLMAAQTPASLETPA